MKRPSSLAHRDLARAQKKALKEGRISVCVDEAAFYLLPGLVRTYAPRGERPILTSVSSYDHLSMMSGITPADNLSTRVQSRALTSSDSVWFLKHLHHHLGKKLLVIWDGCPIHRKEVTTFMAQGTAQYIHLEPLHAYAPDLNPAEGVWHHLKNVELRNVSCQDLYPLRHELNLAIMRLRSKPRLIKSFFAGVGLPLKN
jgi:transposase